MPSEITPAMATLPSTLLRRLAAQSYFVLYLEAEQLLQLQTAHLLTGARHPTKRQQLPVVADMHGVL